MLNYFKEYSWNLSLSLALDMGANIDEVDQASRDLRDGKEPAGLEPAQAFFHAWEKVGKRLQEGAEADENAGRNLSAAEKYRRAAIMYISAERMPDHEYPPRPELYDRMLACFDKYLKLGNINCEKVKVPYKDTYLPAFFVKAADVEKAPCMIHFDGLDGTKEFRFLTKFPEALSQRGVSILVVDTPGVGEALRKLGIHNFPEAEVPAGACIDYLATRGDVDRDRVGVIGMSLGGYHAPRAAAFDERLKCCVVWGANYDWGVRYRQRLAGTAPSHSVPHLFKHVQWVFGVETLEESIAIADRLTLRGILDRIRVPILISHGGLDSQIPVEAAYSTYEDCVNSPQRELKIYSKEETSEQHCHVGNMTPATNYMADWIADVFYRSGKPTEPAAQKP